MHGPGGIRTHNLQVRHVGALSIELQDHPRNLELSSDIKGIVSFICGQSGATLYLSCWCTIELQRDPQVTAGLSHFYWEVLIKNITSLKRFMMGVY